MKNCEQCLASGFYIAVACDGISPNEVILWDPNNLPAVITDNLNNKCYEITTLTIGPATITQKGFWQSCIDCLASSLMN